MQPQGRTRADVAMVGGNDADGVRELARAAARAAAQADWDGGDRELSLRARLREVCDGARASGAQIEHLLIMLKEAWQELPDNRRRMDPEVQATLARMVTICISEYYRPPERF